MQKDEEKKNIVSETLKQCMFESTTRLFKRNSEYCAYRCEIVSDSDF